MRIRLSLIDNHNHRKVLEFESQEMDGTLSKGEQMGGKHMGQQKTNWQML